ncbi:MAG: RICIN domain-containing protein [Tepidisphaeraceae bacterium]
MHRNNFRSWTILTLATIGLLTTRAFADATPSADRRFDFGSPYAVESGYIAVGPATAFTPERGFGWVDQPDLLVRDQGKPDLLRRDFVLGTKPATFRVTGLEPGHYKLSITAADALAGGHATRVTVAGIKDNLPVVAPNANEAATLNLSVIDVKDTLDVTFDSPRENWIVNAIVLTKVDAAGEPRVTREPLGRTPDDNRTHTLVFDTQAPGTKLRLTEWGLDTAWAEPNHMKRGLLYMGKDDVDMVRVSFPISTPLVNGDLPESRNEFFDTRAKIAALAGDKPWTMLPDTDAGVNPWFKDGKDVNPERWLQLMSIAQKRYGKKLHAVEAFNEADWGWGQGSAQNLNTILAALRKHPDFAGVKLGGPSTLSCDAAESWFHATKANLDIGTTHALGGGMPGFLNFFLNVEAAGLHPEHPEVHNLAEVISGAEYGLQSGIWWGTAERARGSFVHAVQGERLAYTEDRANFSAAAVYRTRDGKLQALLGSSERQGKDTEFRFVSKDRPVFFNGVGPTRDITIPIRRDTEQLVDITWGDDVPPAIDGNYVLLNVGSGQVLSVDGGAVTLKPDAQANNAQWEVNPIFTRYGDQAYVTIRSAQTGDTLAIPRQSYDDGAKVLLGERGDWGAENWYLEYAGNNAFNIRSRWSTQCLTAGLDVPVQQTLRAGDKAQQWRLVRASEVPVDLVAPSAVTELTATVKPCAVELRWKPSSERDVIGYTVLRRQARRAVRDDRARPAAGVVHRRLRPRGPAVLLRGQGDGSLAERVARFVRSERFADGWRIARGALRLRPEFA